MSDDPDTKTYLDAHYRDKEGMIHFLSAEDHKNAAHKDWQGPLLPDPSWTLIAPEAVERLINPEKTLEQVKSEKLAQLFLDFSQVKTKAVSYKTTSGQTFDFKNTSDAIALLEEALHLSKDEQDWKANVWLDASNAVVSPFTYDDLLGLQDALVHHPVPDSVTYMSLVAQVRAATTTEAVNDISF